VTPSDTTPEARAVLLDVHRRTDPAERILTVFEMTAAAEAIARAGIMDRHPDYDEAAAEWALRRQRLGDELFTAAWPAAPLLDP